MSEFLKPNDKKKKENPKKQKEPKTLEQETGVRPEPIAVGEGKGVRLGYGTGK